MLIICRLLDRIEEVEIPAEGIKSLPLYPYRCTQCGHRFEKIQKFGAKPEKVCPKCGGALERPLTAPGLSFKGAGWYVNDYAAKSGSSTESSPKDAAPSRGFRGKEAGGGIEDGIFSRRDGRCGKLCNIYACSQAEHNEGLNAPIQDVRAKGPAPSAGTTEVVPLQNSFKKSHYGIAAPAERYHRVGSCRSSIPFRCR